MWIILFAITTVICAIGWMVWYVSSLSMTYYIYKKDTLSQVKTK